MTSRILEKIRTFSFGELKSEHFLIETEGKVIENLGGLIKVTYKSQIDDQERTSWVEVRSDTLLMPAI